MSSRLPKLIVILGPTATGKTKLAVSLAKKFNGEIISADSRQIYQGMDIGTGKDLDDFVIKTQNTNNKTKKKKKNKIPYHLINIVKPNEDFNVAKYKKLALKIIKDIQTRGKVPFLVGGTGLYISAIVDNYDIPAVKPNKEIRKKLEKLNKLEKLKMLKRLDQKTLDFIDVDNPRRLERALEVCLAGKKFSALRKKGKPLFDVLQIGLTFPKNILDKRINQRVDKMIKAGLVNEVKRLKKKYRINSVLSQIIGYKEIIDYLDNNVETRHASSLPDSINLIKTHTRQFAKRQMTWLKRDKRIKWVIPEKSLRSHGSGNKKEAGRIISNWL